MLVSVHLEAGQVRLLQSEHTWGGEKAGSESRFQMSAYNNPPLSEGSGMAGTQRTFLSEGPPTPSAVPGHRRPWAAPRHKRGARRLPLDGFAYGVLFFLYSGHEWYFPVGGNKVQEGPNYLSLITWVNCEIRN